ncbi:MAG: glycosyltransferase family 9 protein [Planctomycetota bacterium]|nr:glycosyltransferase family 9 protein [Planctomycetota bacterium]
MLALPTDRPARILLVRLSHMGDALHALPVFHALRDHHPDAEVWWAIQPEFAGFLDNLPGLHGVIPYHRHHGLKGWKQLRLRLKELRFDCAINAQGNWKSAAVARLSGAPIRLANAKSDWREASASWLANRFASPAGGVHAMHRMDSLCQAIGSTAPLRWDLPLTANELRQGQQQLQSLLPDSGPARILHLSAPGDPRSWPMHCYAELAASLAAKGEQILCLSGPSEQDAGVALAAELKSQDRVKHLVGQRGLRPLAGLLKAAANRRMRMLATDSGPSHMASAVGLPVDLLAGPTHPERTGPWPTTAPNHCLQDLETRSMDSLDSARVYRWLTGT